LGDDRNKLVLEYARLVREIKPRAFMLENVDQLGQKRGKEFLARVQKELRDYILYPNFYNSADFGVAQTRLRFITVGIRKDLDVLFVPPPPTVKKWCTIRQAIGDLPPPPADYSEHPDFPNHYQTRITQINIERFSHVPEGGGWQDIPEEIRLPCHREVDTTAGGCPDVYGRLRWNGQVPTITGGFDSFTRGRYGHPSQHRAITPREAARLQGFPDSYRFHGTKSQVRAQLGNAVPVPLAAAVGQSISRVFEVADGLTDRYEDELTGTHARQLVLNV
jgi:DNA (cytosine-5)-methyltransferase 1